MIARNTAYKACAVWGIGLISLVLGMPIVAIFAKGLLIWYFEIGLVY